MFWNLENLGGIKTINKRLCFDPMVSFAAKVEIMDAYHR